MNDLTVIFLTANRVPDGWAQYHRDMLQKAIGDTRIITISRKYIPGWTVLLDEQPYHISNIYYQLLRGAKEATTDYIAVVEDDTLYPAEHFVFRPPLDTFAYNMNRFNIFRWSRRPTYFWKNRQSNSTLIAPRQLLIDALEERFSKYPDGTPTGFTGELGRKNVEENLGVTPRKFMWFQSEEVSVVRVDHEEGVDRLSRTHRKGMGILRAYSIPYWGDAKEVIAKFI